jgi:hypothetical protein
VTGRQPLSSASISIVGSPQDEASDRKTLAHIVSIYATERQDQQTAGNAAIAIVAAGLAYAGVATAVLTENCRDECDVDAAVVVSAPLPVVALMSFLLLILANAAQRARYLVKLEEELEPALSQPGGVKIPTGFRRSEPVFNPATAAGMRRVASAAMTGLAYGALFAVEIGFTLYALHLVDAALKVVALTSYGVAFGLQAIALVTALRPLAPELADDPSPPVAPADMPGPGDSRDRAGESGA